MGLQGTLLKPLNGEAIGNALNLRPDAGVCAPHCSAPSRSSLCDCVRSGALMTNAGLMMAALGTDGVSSCYCVLRDSWGIFSVSASAGDSEVVPHLVKGQYFSLAMGHRESKTPVLSFFCRLPNSWGVV